VSDKAVVLHFANLSTDKSAGEPARGRPGGRLIDFGRAGGKDPPAAAPPMILSLPCIV
jgi:hypothetical protein